METCLLSKTDQETQAKTKVCFKCGDIKPVDDFYKHPQMADGYVNKCKECNKRDVSLNYRTNIRHYIEYEKNRFQDPDRKLKALGYQSKRRKLSPEKNKAREAISNALRDGRVVKSPCEVCGNEESQAHHEDYSKPLEVQWLCRSCHLKIHGKRSYSELAF